MPIKRKPQPHEAVSTRAQIITRRTYNRPLDQLDASGGPSFSGTVEPRFETWDQTVQRVIDHQAWLWERAKGRKLNRNERSELLELQDLMRWRKALCSGRTLWLGGTEVSRTRESSMFNCSFGRAETVYDIVDFYWLLLQGCGVGFEPIVGVLSGFTRPVELEVLRSENTDPTVKGNPENVETFEGALGDDLTWTIRVGDSVEAWSKVPGKLLANKKPCKKLVLDFREIRPAGTRLKNYGWISSGDDLLAKALTSIVHLLNQRATLLLSRLDIMDIMNHLGATLSSRRSAEITLVPYGDPEWIDFATAKKNYWIDNPHRGQSNNSVVFYHRPSKAELTDLFNLMIEAGGSEPGFINGAAALKRAPWFRGVNP